MISIEVWRARIGSFNNKRYSGFLSSLFSFSSYYYYHPRKRRNHSPHTAVSTAAKAGLTSSSSFLMDTPSAETHSPDTCISEKASSEPFATIPTTSILPSSSSSFSSSSSSSSSSSFSSFLFTSFTSLFLMHHSLLREILVILLIAIISQQLIISGDIETNPGPKRGADDKPDLSDLLYMSYTGDDGRDVYFRLMDQLKPHWRRLAIALKFPQHEIDTMTREDDPVYYLLKEWLRGANKEKDSRPASWKTLIEALRHANVQEEATVLEEKLILGLKAALHSEYTLQVKAQSDVKTILDSELSDSTLIHVPISQPGKPFATKVTHDSIILKWNRPEQGAQNLKHYTVVYYSANCSAVTHKVSNIIAESTTLLNLDSKTVYFAKVKAKTFLGSSSESKLSDPIETKLSPPGRPHASNNTYKGFHVNWQKPNYSGIQYYYVSYQATDDPPDKWGTIVTTDDTPTIYFNGVVGKHHVFKVAAVTDEGSSSVSDLSDPVETLSVPLGVKICKGLNPIPNSYPPTYLLLTHCVMKKRQIVKIHVAVNSHQKATSGVHTGCLCYTRTAGIPHKVLMLVGATGAGKTTLINGMANYILGVQWDDDFRFKLIDEPNSLNQTVSQTACITAYTFYKEKSSPLPYTLTVINTPGFDDTGGIDRDKKIVQQIKELFTIPGAEGIDQLHGIGFVTQAPLARLTPTQRYVFDAILSVFGKDVTDNIFLMITFADGMPPPVIDAVKAADVPYQAFFKFNNSALFASKSADDEFDKVFWKMGANSFQEFFKQFSTAKTQSLQQTREVIQEREKLQTIIRCLKSQIKFGLTRIDVIQQKRRILMDHEAAILSKKNFTNECAETEDVTKIVDELKKKYDSVMDSKDEIEKAIKTMKYELEILNSAVLHKIDQAHRCIARLQQIALKPDHLTEVDYIDILIESEKYEAKDRWWEREALEGVHAQIVTELRRNPERQQHSLSSAEESPQEKV